MALVETIKRYKFLFEELVKRDFKKKYKRTVLGMGWSLLSPLLNVLVLMLVFVVPLVIACATFVLCAMWMQAQEGQVSAEKHGLA